MGKAAKVFKWTGIVLASIIVLFVAAVFIFNGKTYDAPYPDIKATKDSAAIARGEYLAYGLGHCAGCHVGSVDDYMKVAAGQHIPLSGGFEFELGPMGFIRTPNITPDPETGIGKLSDQEIARALRYGVGHDGRAIFDFMPFHNLSDEDLTAIISFLRSQPPVKHEVEVRDLNFLGKAVNAFMIKPVGPEGEVAKSVKPDTTAEYGKYLVLCIANCRGCHTNRDITTGAYTGPDFAGGFEMESTLVPGTICVTPNLTPDPETGHITNWSEEQFIARFRAGATIKASEMPWDMFKTATDNDLKAIYHYLKTLKPVKNKIEKIVTTKEELENRAS
ncbi:MAG: cytochrome c [Chlorobi bacterium]|nr:cytochrome c [Chlorobiota bacterium]